MGGSSSSSSQSQTTLTDSQNKVLNNTLNVSDTGNVKINLGDAAIRTAYDGGGTANLGLILGAAGLAGLGILLAFQK